MIGLDEAKAIIHGADPDLDSDRYFEIEASAVFQTGWSPLGDDYFYNETNNLIAGPCSGGSIRILADLNAAECRGETNTEFHGEICDGMEKEPWRQGIVGF